MLKGFLQLPSFGSKEEKKQKINNTINIFKSWYLHHQEQIIFFNKKISLEKYFKNSKENNDDLGFKDELQNKVKTINIAIDQNYIKNDFDMLMFNKFYLKAF